MHIDMKHSHHESCFITHLVLCIILYMYSTYVFNTWVARISGASASWVLPVTPYKCRPISYVVMICTRASVWWCWWCICSKIILSCTTLHAPHSKRLIYNHSYLYEFPTHYCCSWLYYRTASANTCVENYFVLLLLYVNWVVTFVKIKQQKVDDSWTAEVKHSVAKQITGAAHCSVPYCGQSLKHLS